MSVLLWLLVPLLGAPASAEEYCHAGGGGTTGCEQVAPKAFEQLEQACEGGSKAACVRVARLYSGEFYVGAGATREVTAREACARRSVCLYTPVTLRLSEERWELDDDLVFSQAGGHLDDDGLPLIQTLQSGRYPLLIDALVARREGAGQLALIVHAFEDLPSEQVTRVLASAEAAGFEEVALRWKDATAVVQLHPPRTPSVTASDEASSSDEASAADGSPDAGGEDKEKVVLGALPKAAIQATIEAHMKRIRRCYTKGLIEDRDLAGKLVIKFVIAKDGTVSKAEVKSSELDDSFVEGCITGEFMKMQFPEPEGGGIVIVSFPFVFTPG